MYKVSIVIPNWNGEEKLKENLPKVLEVKGVFEVIVVDDRSTDKSVELVEQKFPNVKLLKKDRNSGFTSTVNLGVKESGGDLVFLLNTDAAPQPDCLQYVLPHFIDEKTFSVGFNTGGSWSWAKFEEGYFWHFQSNEKPKEAHQTLWVSGGSGVFRKNVWDQLEGLDELYNPFYEEDVDLGYRAVKRGFINLWEPRAYVEHIKNKGVISENFSSKRIQRVAQRNQLFFIWKNITSEKLINTHLNNLAKKLISHPKYWLIFASAFMKIDKIRKRREEERGEQVVTDEEILNRF